MQITDNVVDRIKVELEKAADEAHRPAPSAAQDQPPPQSSMPPPPPPSQDSQKAPEEQAPPPPPPAPTPAPAPPAPPAPQSVPVDNSQKPVIQYVEREPSMSSLRVKAEKEKELTEAETYWRKRFAKQEREV